MKVGNTDNGFMINGVISSREKGNPFFVGNMNKATDTLADRIEKKRNQAKAQAFKIIGDVYANDKKLDDSMAKLEDKAAGLLEENKKTGEDLKKSISEQKDLMKQYGISEDSDEQEELKLLEKRYDYEKQGKKLSDEEEEKLAQIDAKGLSEYQSRSMELYDRQSDMKDKIDDNEAAAAGILSAVRDTGIERLKSNEMIDAKKAADEINDAASKEIIGMIIDDAKDSIDDKTREAQEKAEEKAREKEEKEKAEEKKKENDTSQNTKAPDNYISDAQNKIQDVLDKMKLLDEDIKGIKVDTTFRN